MSTDAEKTEITQREAEKKAQETLAFEIGSLPQLGDAIQWEAIEPDYVFPLEVRLPRVIFDKEGKRPIDVEFTSPRRIGTVCIDGKTGKVRRTDLPRIDRRIRAEKRKINEAVQKALVLSSARQFSRLPFPTHRYTPILDILSHLLVEGPIKDSELADLDEHHNETYEEYIDQLRQVDLVYRRGDEVAPDGTLTEIMAEEPDHPKQLNAALAHFFEAGADNIETIRRILGPYLVLSGYYYRRALEVGDSDPPTVSEDEFKQELERYYSGKDGMQKKFKLSRYLIQLEEVDMLQKSGSDPSQPAWEGVEGIKEALIGQHDLMKSVPGALA